MGSIWVREFTGGLDTRRLPETTPGGTLLTARNGHITRGGEFEQRAAIQKAYDLPPNTFGLAYQQGALFIFAETDPGGALDSDIGFFEIKHPDGITNPARVLSWDLFAGLIYASVRFADDSVYHFYNLNQRIDIWFDGKARASFTVTGGTDATASAAASGSFDITAVLSTGSVTVSHIYIGTKDLLASPVVFATSGGVSAVLDRGLLATALANAIAANSGSSGYTATAANSKVVVTATTAGPAPNRLEILPSYSTSEVTMTIGVMGGGTDALSGSVTSVKIDGVESLSAPVVYTGTPESMAAALAAAMDANAATTHFDVTSDGATVTIAADTGGTAANDLRATLETIKANVAFDKLQQMRAASPTGGALGAVSDKEMSLLSSALTSLDQSQSAEQLMQNLNNLEAIYKTITDKLNAPPADATAPAAQPTPSTGQITLPPDLQGVFDKYK